MLKSKCLAEYLITKKFSEAGNGAGESKQKWEPGWQAEKVKKPTSCVLLFNSFIHLYNGFSFFISLIPISCSLALLLFLARSPRTFMSSNTAQNYTFLPLVRSYLVKRGELISGYTAEDANILSPTTAVSNSPSRRERPQGLFSYSCLAKC